MCLKLKKMIASIVVVCMLMPFLVVYADESNSEMDIDERLWNQAVMNIEALEKERELKEWNLLTQEEKYNKMYVDYLEILISYYNEFLVLQDSLSEPLADSISGRCYNLMTKIDEVAAKASNLTTESKYAYSKGYLVSSFYSLKKIVNSLDTYDLYMSINDINSANDISKQIEEELEIFMDTFTKAYNYYVLIRRGGVVTDSLNQSEDTFYSQLKKNFDLIDSSFEMLAKAHQLIKANKNGSEFISNIEKSISSVSLLNMKTLENKSTIIKVNNAIELIKKATKELEYYSFDVMTEGKGDDSKYLSTYQELKIVIEEINTELNNIGSKVKSISDNVSEKVSEIENEELKIAHKNGYNSVDEYYAALRKQQELEYLDKVLQEYRRLYEEKEKLQREYEEMLAYIHEQWLYERIDFSKAQNMESVK